MNKLEAHPYAVLIPAMSAEEYDELVEDIRSRGFRDEDPIVLYEGKILDGRHRYRACSELRVEPSFREYEGDDPAGYVISANLHRRHLEPGQRAVVALAFKEKLAKEAAERKAATQIHGVEMPANPGERQLATTGKTDVQLAKLAGVGEGTITRVSRVQRERPDLIEKVASGEMTANAAYTETTGYSTRGGNGKAATAPSQTEPSPKPRHRFDTKRIVEATISSLEGLAMGLKLVNLDGIEPEVRKDWAEQLTKALRPIRQLRDQLNKENT